ncbi:MAG: DUF1028 domain-containing protein [Caldilinea sp.]|jgi:uncharacterized Ntn-hydrolase superfamily protein|nr:DUF1028 domain-containing protein [Caldilinea sp.]
MSMGDLVTTFSILGYDPHEPAWGIAIASRFLAVGARTCWGEPTAGVVVIQAYANTGNGKEGVRLLQQGLSADATIEQLMAKDRYRHLRQMAVIDWAGNVATYTGEGCTDWAGGVVGAHCAAQGNMLANGDGCAAMVEHFERSSGPLERRLVDALTLGERVGGDARGRQAAALYTVRQPFAEAYDVFTEPVLSLRVDDHPNPCGELSRLVDLYELVYFATSEQERTAPTPEIIKRYQVALQQRGYYAGSAHGQLDEATRQGLGQLARTENFRKRLPAELPWLDLRLLDHLEGRKHA